VATAALARLGTLTGEVRFTSAAERLLDIARPLAERAPSAVADLLLAGPLVVAPAEVVVSGDRPDLVNAVHRRWLPGAVTAWGEPTRSPLWDGRAPGRAYVCHGYVCLEPATDPDTLCRLLDRLEQPGVPTHPGTPGRPSAPPEA
jgi:uncharacterized protein YyaL (SSP411 family)